MDNSSNNIRIEFDEANNQSLAFVNDVNVGECEFTVENGNKWYITHTGVRPEYGGQGIAKMLVLRVIEEARKKSARIVPICSYAQKMTLDKEEYKDVLY